MMQAMTEFLLSRAGRHRRAFFALLAARGAAALAGWGAAAAWAKSAPDVLLAHNAPRTIDPSNYLVSEKFDGVRAIWDGSVLRFRSGRVVAAPSWFTAKLPRSPLDGELWLARNQFDALSGMVRKAQPVDAEWQRVQYLVFELPQGAGTFAERAAKLYDIVKTTAWPQLHAVEQLRIGSRAALQKKLNETINFGGEGLMLHQADAPYTTGRSQALLKLKNVQDAEATVVAHHFGKGKYANMLGALEVKTTEGLQFKLGSGLSDALRKNPPAIGTVVSYAYRDLTPQGLPRFASFLRVYELD
jgi:DNA ligase 1